MVKLAQTKRDVENAFDQIEAMIHHQIRVAWNEQHRVKLFEKLSEYKAIITMDWAQKWLPMRSRETQKHYYAERGMPYHITTVQTKIKNHRSGSEIMVQRTIVHIFDAEYQASLIVN